MFRASFAIPSHHDIPALIAEGFRRMLRKEHTLKNPCARLLHAMGVSIDPKYDDAVEEPNGWTAERRQFGSLLGDDVTMTDAQTGHPSFSCLYRSIGMDVVEQNHGVLVEISCANPDDDKIAIQLLTAFTLDIVEAHMALSRHFTG